MISFAAYRSIICLDGDLPAPQFFRTYPLPILAADGAANKLMAIDITPTLTIGDLDSVSPALRASLPMLAMPDQNSCDFQKVLAYAEQEDLLPAIILGVNGGYLDHILNNINIFLSTGSILYAPPLIGFTLQAGDERSMSLPLNTKISLLGIPSARVDSIGLKWELTDYPLQFPGTTSCFNRSVQEVVKLMVQQGTCLVLLYDGSEGLTNP